MTEYDSTKDTLLHIRTVQKYLSRCLVDIIWRSQGHDSSKLHPPEKDAFDRETPKLAQLEYGSEEYKESLKRLGPALEHHYKVNRHHPEFFDNGVYGMNLLDVLEMLCDWKAASERGKDKVLNLTASFERFKIEPQLQEIMKNTCDTMGWNYK